VWAVAVVVAGEDAEGALEVTLVHDQEPVETFGADGADETLGGCVRSWRSHWSLDDLDTFAGEDGVEVMGELAVAVADQESETILVAPGASRRTGAPAG
jgi:hypothetical protein